MCEAHIHANTDTNTSTNMRTLNPHHTNKHAYTNVTHQETCDDFATWSTLTHKWTQSTQIHCWRQGETIPPRTKREIQVWIDNCSCRQVYRPSCRGGTMRGAIRKSRAVAKGLRRIFHRKWNLSWYSLLYFQWDILRRPLQKICLFEPIPHKHARP